MGGTPRGLLVPSSGERLPTPALSPGGLLVHGSDARLTQLLLKARGGRNRSSSVRARSISGSRWKAFPVPPGNHSPGLWCQTSWGGVLSRVGELWRRPPVGDQRLERQVEGHDRTNGSGDRRGYRHWQSNRGRVRLGEGDCSDRWPPGGRPPGNRRAAGVQLSKSHCPLEDLRRERTGASRPI